MFIQMEKNEALKVLHVLQENSDTAAANVRFNERYGEDRRTAYECLAEAESAESVRVVFKNALALGHIDQVMELRKVG